MADDAGTSRPPSAGWRAVFVVGAGRSGTSALTRGLQALGVDLGDRLKAPTGKNPTGFFEDRDLLDVAKRARRALGLRSESVALVEPGSWQRPELAALQREAADTMRRRFGASPLWGFKYAQTLRYLPFWEEVFRLAELDASFLVASRNPLSVARSRQALDAARGVQEKSDLEWLVNVVPYFGHLRGRLFAVVDYDRLMDAPAFELGRVAERLRLPQDEATREAVRAYADSFLQDGRRHTLFGLDELEKDARLNPLVRDAYRWLWRLACDEVAADSRELWSEWERLEALLQLQAPLLRHLDGLEAERRRRPLAALASAWRSWRGRSPGT